MNNYDNDWLLDTISILSFIIGIQNLSMNNQQVNALEEHLRKQDEQYDRILKLLEDIKSLREEG